MDTIARFLEREPLLALFLVISVGYAAGQINIKGFFFGVGAVLFSGLALGAISPNSSPPPLVGTLGLVLFLYGIGIQYGTEFFAGLSSKTGIKYNLLAFGTLIASAGVSVLLMKVSGLPISYLAGLFAGATTTASAMMAAVEAARNNDPAIAYSVSLPFGILGTILCMYFMQLLVKPRIDTSIQKRIQTAEVEVASMQIAGRTVGELIPELPGGVKILAIRSGQVNRIPDPEHVLVMNDALLLGSEDADLLHEAVTLIGQQAHGRIVKDRSDLDYLRVFASKHQVIGSRLSELKFPNGIEVMIAQVQRGDTGLLAAPDLVLEFGDRVGILCNRSHFETLRKFFGDSIRGTTEFSYVALGIGMVLGVIVGIIPFPVPGLGILKLGVAGGVLIVSLILGKLGHTGSFTWTMPLSANIILRNFGIALFLAQIGMSSGQKFITTLHENGFLLLILGAIILLPLVLIPLLAGHFLMRIPFDDLLGVTSGLGGNAAIVSYASKAVPSERVEISYAMIYPGAIILKIIIVQALIAVWSISS